VLPLFIGDKKSLLTQPLMHATSIRQSEVNTTITPSSTIFAWLKSWPMAALLRSHVITSAFASGLTIPACVEPALPSALSIARAFHVFAMIPERVDQPDDCIVATNSAKLRRGKVMLCNAPSLKIAKRKFGKFFWMQYSGENFDAVDNPRPRTGKVSARINQINLTRPRSWH
jgi:hypothetical protein